MSARQGRRGACGRGGSTARSWTAPARRARTWSAAPCWGASLVATCVLSGLSQDRVVCSTLWIRTARALAPALADADAYMTEHGHALFAPRVACATHLWCAAVWLHLQGLCRPRGSCVNVGTGLQREHPQDEYAAGYHAAANERSRERCASPLCGRARWRRGRSRARSRARAQARQGWRRRAASPQCQSRRPRAWRRRRRSPRSTLPWTGSCQVTGYHASRGLC